MSKQFFVYIMSNDPISAILYTGMTRRPPPPRLAAQEQADTGFYKPLQPDLSRLLRGLRLSRRGYLPRQRNQRLAAQQEDCSHRVYEPSLEDLAKDWQGVYKLKPVAGCREIPHPAGENAGLRDDTNR
jgi:hypothetical protein